jgi:hypothetical protein
MILNSSSMVASHNHELWRKLLLLMHMMGLPNDITNIHKNELFYSGTEGKA